MKVKYRRKYPDAIQYHDEMRVNDTLPVNVSIQPTPQGDAPFAFTSKGCVRISDGMWIVTDVNGMVSVHTDEIFNVIFEPVE